ncbi:MAG: hypothetical protein WB392_08590 [Methanotrichaceae archaeon]
MLTATAVIKNKDEKKMKNSIAVGLILISILFALSLGVVFAEVSKDKVNATSSINITKNVTNTTNASMPMNTTSNSSTKKILNYTMLGNATLPNYTVLGNATLPKYKKLA